MTWGKMSKWIFKTTTKNTQTVTCREIFKLVKAEQKKCHQMRPSTENQTRDVKEATYFANRLIRSAAFDKYFVLWVI